VVSFVGADQVLRYNKTTGGQQEKSEKFADKGIEFFASYAKTRRKAKREMNLRKH